MDAKAPSAIRLNLSDEVIHALIDEEKAKNLPKVRAPIYGEKFD
jgi:hypothetical protein